MLRVRIKGLSNKRSREKGKIIKIIFKKIKKKICRELHGNSALEIEN